MGLNDGGAEDRRAAVQEDTTLTPQEQFEKTWSTPPGWLGWFAAVNNQPLGIRFMVTAFIFFTIGGALALLMRVQLSVSENTFLGPQIYNQLFTMHGSTMMYLFAVPFLEGLALYLVPMMIGSRDVCFPRLTAFSYWMYLFGGLIFYASFIFGKVPEAGWFAYVPLSGPRFSDEGMDFWLMGLAMVEVAGLCAGAEIVVTILKFRAPGMTLNRMPLLVWALLAAGLMILFAFTTLLMATVLLELDRVAGTAFFDVNRGGSSLLWQHLFWFFGHPEVYIIFLPATGIVSMVVTAFARRISGYVLITVAIVVTAFVSFGLWVHHMYTTGLPELSMNFFAGASLMIGIASGTQVFAWIASLWGRRPELKTPLLFVLGFIFIFVLGGLTGAMIAIVPFDWQVHDTFFIVAHFHYVLIGGALFPIFAGLHFWIPKITGRLMDDRLGAAGFWLLFVGFNVTFFPMHIMGFLGLPRRVYTYSSTLGLDGMNILATVGAFVFAAGFVVFLVNLLISSRRGAVAGDSPWRGDTLEWSLSSPPPSFSFHAPPVVQSRHPQWQDTSLTAIPLLQERARAALTGAPHTWRATLVTDAVAAQPQAVQALPGPTLLPLLAAVGFLISAFAVLMQAYLLLPVGLVYAIGIFVLWLNPDDQLADKIRASGIEEKSGLPVFPLGTKATGWWAMLTLITIWGMAFAVLVFTYFYLWLFSEEWPQMPVAAPDAGLPLIAFALLAFSAWPAFFGWRFFQRGKAAAAKWSFLLLAASGAGFLMLQAQELSRQLFTPATNAYASIFYTVHGLLAVTVLLGLGLAAAALFRLFGRRSRSSDAYMLLQMQVTRLFWYFVAVVGAAMFLMLYVAPHVI